MSNKNNTNNTTLKKLKNILPAAIFWVAVWQVVAILIGNELLFPSFTQTLKAFFGLMLQKKFYLSILLSFARIFSGLTLGVVVGILLGSVCTVNKTADILLSPIKNIIKALPVASVIVLILLWVNKSTVSVVIAFLTVAPIIWTSVYQGILSTDADLIEMADFFMLSPFKKIKAVYITGILPQFLASLTTALGFAFKSGVAAEVIATPAFSIGKGIYESKLYLETPELFGWTLSVILISMFIEKVLVKAVKRFIK